MSRRKPEEPGTVFNNWKIIRYSHAIEKRFYTVECTECGKQKTIRIDYIKKIPHKHRVKKPKPVIDNSNKILNHTIITGKVFGHLTVERLESIRFTETNRKYFYYICRCECGNKKIMATNNLGRKNINCGCLNKKYGSPRIHGDSDSDEHLTWRRMVEMCYNQLGSHYQYYGKKGITVDRRWLGEAGYVNFLEDMGRKPQFRSCLRRRNRKLGFSKENCYWSHWKAGRRKKDHEWLNGQENRSIK